MDFSRITACILCALTAFGIHAGAQEFGQDRYSAGIAATYGNNYTWGNYGAVGVRAFMPVHKYFSMDVQAHYLTPGVAAVNFTARPHMMVGTSELMADVKLCYKPYMVYKSTDFVYAFLAGFRRDYISIQAGFHNRVIDSVQENFIFTYNVMVSVRPHQSRWNLGLGVSNFNEYGYERMLAPMALVKAWWNIGSHLCMNADFYFKPTGIFHQTTSYYSITSSIGINYVF